MRGKGVVPITAARVALGVRASARAHVGQVVEARHGLARHAVRLAPVAGVAVGPLARIGRNLSGLMERLYLLVIVIVTPGTSVCVLYEYDSSSV